MSIEQRELEIQLISEIQEVGTKDAAILDLKRKWEREDNSSCAGLITSIVLVVAIGCVGYFLGHYYGQKQFKDDIVKIAALESRPGDTYQDFYYHVWDYVYDKYRENLK